MAIVMGSQRGDVWAYAGCFSHEALFYAGREAFVEATAPFIREGVEAGEPVLVVVDTEKIEALRHHLDGAADNVHFADMATIGRNPATIIPAWQDFLNRHAPSGRRVRGIGEPIWAGRTPQELVECHLHESLLNLAFSGASFFWLICPYDTVTLEPTVIREAERTHPVVVRDGARTRSSMYAGIPISGLDSPLPDPPADARLLAFGDGSLSALRSVVTAEAGRAGLDAGRASELVVAVNEVATNSIRHGGGRGMLRVWHDEAGIVCEVRDRGRIENLLAGRALPETEQTGGYGLWLVNHICDLVQVRSVNGEGVVRLYMNRR